MHEMFITPGIVDGAVVHKQAQKHLLDRYSPHETIVHAHAYQSYCNDQCVVYKFPQMLCPDCEGFGKVKKKQPGLASKLVEEKCKTCDGLGEIRDPEREPGDVNADSSSN